MGDSVMGNSETPGILVKHKNKSTGLKTEGCKC